VPVFGVQVDDCVPASFPDGRRALAGARAGRHHELDGAEHEQPHHDDRGADDQIAWTLVLP